jgi:hypothetical protein
MSSDAWCLARSRRIRTSFAVHGSGRAATISTGSAASFLRAKAGLQFCRGKGVSQYLQAWLLRGPVNRFTLHPFKAVNLRACFRLTFAQNLLLVTLLVLLKSTPGLDVGDVWWHWLLAAITGIKTSCTNRFVAIITAYFNLCAYRDALAKFIQPHVHRGFAATAADSFHFFEIVCQCQQAF